MDTPPTREGFVAAYGAVFEHSPWVAEQAWGDGPFATVGELHAAMVVAVDAAPHARQLELLRAHPDLSDRARRAAVTDASAREQAAAGLDAIDAARAADLARLTTEYRARFGFPFIACAREHTPDSLVAWAGERLAHGQAEEERTALAEVAKIARLRLDDLAGA